MSVTAAALLQVLIAAVLVGAQSKEGQNLRPVQDPFIGTWLLNVPKSTVSPSHTGERYVSSTRKYEADGEKTRVSWVADFGNGRIDKSSYSSKCDGSLENANGKNRIKCWYVNPAMVEGEFLSGDPSHQHYRRELSSDGRTMTITWFADVKRKKASDILIFDRQQ